MTTFATIAELKAFIGTTAHVSGISDANLTTMMALSYGEICIRLRSEDVSIPASDVGLNAAELNLSMNRVVTRGKLDGTLTDAEGSAGDYGVSDLDSSIYILYTRGWELVDMYIKEQNRKNKNSYPKVHKVN